MYARLLLPKGLCICRSADCLIPWGTCHCGCGGQTKIADKSDAAYLAVRGEPLRFIPGHQGVRHPEKYTIGRFKIDGVYCHLVPLSQGLWAIVDESDYERVMEHKWSAKRSEETGGCYAYRSELRDGKRVLIYMAREIMGFKPGDRETVDHIDPWNTLDNRRANLRVATMAEQNRNHRKQRNNTSGFKGVSYNKNMHAFGAYIQLNGKLMGLGYRSTAEAALTESFTFLRH